MFRSNCHTHTTYCDGKNSAREMIEAAISCGFVSIGFSGHSPMKTGNEWTMTKASVREYVNEIRALKEEYKDKIDILCGIELDGDYCDVCFDDFDYMIGSIHQFNKNGEVYDVDYTPEKLSEAVDKLFSSSFNQMSKCYYQMLADFILKTDVDIVGHIDLITKFNDDTALFDENDAEYRKIVLEAVDRILDAKPEIVFEVNTGAMYRVGKKTPYPAQFILEHISSRNGKITLTSDAHDTRSLNFAFDEVLELIKKCGFNEVLYLTAEGWKSNNL